MGIVKDAVAGAAAAAASKSRRHVFVYRFDLSGKGSLSGELDGAAAVIDAVEAQGWALQDMTAGASLVLLFRRR